MARFSHDFSLLKKLLVQFVDPILIFCLLKHQFFVQLDAVMALALIAFICGDVKVLKLSEVFRTAQMRYGETFGLLLLR